MIDADMIDAVSTMYGSTLTPTVGTNDARGSEIESDFGTRVGRWGDTEYSAVLYRSPSYASRFRMVVSAVRLNALASTTSLLTVPTRLHWTSG
jgi:hypothetical protein